MQLRFRNPLKQTDIPDHMVGEGRAFRRWLTLTAAFAMALSLFAMASTPLIFAWLGYGIRPLMALPLSEQIYWFYHDLFAGNFYALQFLFLRSMGGHGLYGGLAYVFVMLVTMLVCMTPQLFNPYEPANRKQGNVQWADDRTLKQMHERQQVGIIGGQYGMLGKWGKGKFKGQAVRLIETLSVLCLAPPGTGKTAALVFPTIVTTDECSFIISDPKPEVHEATAHYKSQRAHVFKLDWAKIDEPEKGIFHPRFNFLSPKLVPPAGPDRDTYLDTVAKTLIPDNEKGDKYFQDRGRAALTAFMHYLVAKVGDARNFDGLPDQWHGKEPSIPMLSDWIATAQFESKKRAEEEAMQNGGAPQGGDALSKWLEELAESCDQKAYTSAQSDPERKNKFFNAPRAFNEFVNLAATADKERSGVLNTMDAALIPFKNAAVAQRTSASDFTPDDFRGIKDPDTGEWKPVCLYVCSNQSEAASFSRITALLYEVLANSLLTHKYSAVNPRTGRELGPFKVCFLMEEFAKHPKMEVVSKSRDTGRSSGDWVLFIFLNDTATTAIYTKEELEILTSTTSVKYILAQNDADTAKWVQEMVGQTTLREQKLSYTEGLSKGASPFASGRSEDFNGVSFLRSEDITATPFGKHIVLAQGFLNRPMLLDTPYFFKDPEMASKIYSRGKGTPGTQILPPHINNERRIGHALDQKRSRRKRLDHARTEMRNAYRPPSAIRHGP